mgnify:CR=1 FL=1
MFNISSYKAIQDICNGIILEDFQCVDLLNTLKFPTKIISYDTGLGKTVLASAFIRALVNEIPSRRFIMVVEKSQLIQTPDKVRSLTGLSVQTITAQSEDINNKLFEEDFLKHQVLMITYETLNNPGVMLLLYKYKKFYNGIIVDEAHKVCNFEDASQATMLKAMLPNFEYRLMLTATPITSGAKQLVYLLHMLDPKLINDVADYIRDVERGYSPLNDFPNHIIVRTRRDLGIISNYRTHIELVNPHPWQVNASGPDMINIVKGERAENQAKRVLEIVQKHKGQRGLIYIHKHKLREWVQSILEPCGVRVGCIHGKISAEERISVLNKLKTGEIDVIITSVTTALDMEADYIIFYEFTTDIKQMLGRAERGLNPKTLDLYFIFTRETEEISRFIQNIYNRSLLIQNVLRKDYSELIRVGYVLKSM